MPVEDVKGILLAGARGECNGAIPGGQAPEGALPGVWVFPLKKGQREPAVLSR